MKAHLHATATQVLFNRKYMQTALPLESKTVVGEEPVVNAMSGQLSHYIHVYAGEQNSEAWLR